MRIAVASCWKYRDAWGPFFALLERFWPNHPQTHLLLDKCDDLKLIPSNVNLFTSPGEAKTSWGGRVADFADAYPDEPILLLQEDFFLNAPISGEFVQYCVNHMKDRDAASIRLYPCPGADDYCGNDLIGLINRDSRYRVSCQATVWEPSVLAKLTRLFRKPSDLELHGTNYAAEHIPQDMLAIFRDSRPWPISYICTAIVQGLWMPEAKRFCDALDIQGDWTMRGFRTA